jgi:hypothetical protein
MSKVVTTKSLAMDLAAAVEAACHTATMEFAADSSTVEAPSSKASTTMEAASAETATMEAASTKATASHAASVAATASTSTTSQRHRWRSQADGRNCQQRDRYVTQHDDSPSEISLPTKNCDLELEIVSKDLNLFGRGLCSTLRESHLTEFKATLVAWRHADSNR